MEITPSGTVTEFSTGITPGSVPKSIAAGPDGNMWFTEAFGNRIGRITPTGTVTEFDGDSVDASLLLLALHGYADARGERMQRTCARIYAELGGGRDLLFRYRGDDGLRGTEGAFGICSFWGVEYRARAGDLAGCRQRDPGGLRSRPLP